MLSHDQLNPYDYLKCVTLFEFAVKRRGIGGHFWGRDLPMIFSTTLMKMVYVAAILPSIGVAPLLDIRCGNPRARGTFNCAIERPIVNQPKATYPVVFAAGDRVIVAATGCVQTGGSGLTWKRYVNPSGPNSDRLYHGLIQLPGTGLVRIATVNGEQQTVGSAGSLVLGYEDDDYSDNGYTGHDNGTQDQCKGVGAARVTVTITRR